MKITVYELLGLIKDGKAPNKIKYNENIYYYDKGFMNYSCDLNDGDTLYLLEDTIEYLVMQFNYEVEIIEEDVEITKWGDFAIDEVENKQLKMDNIKKYIAIIMRTQNEIIDEVKKLKGK